MADDEGIKAVITRLVEAWNRHDMHTFAGLFTEDGEYVTGLGERLTGPEAIERGLRDAQAHDPAAGEIQLHKLWTKILAPGVAMLHVSWEMQHPPDVTDSPGHARSGTVLMILARVDGVWRIATLKNTETTPR